jgi:hypothetical protein
MPPSSGRGKMERLRLRFKRLIDRSFFGSHAKDLLDSLACVQHIPFG